MSTTLTTQIEEAQAVLSAATTVRDRAKSRFYKLDTEAQYQVLSGSLSQRESDLLQVSLAELSRAEAQVAAAEQIVETLLITKELQERVTSLASVLSPNPLFTPYNPNEDRCEACGALEVNCDC